jgi:hypothetical protein
MFSVREKSGFRKIDESRFATWKVELGTREWHKYARSPEERGLTFKIDSFETYHVGIKLSPAVSLDILANKMREILGKEGYVLPKDTVAESRVRFIPPVEIVAAKNDVRVEMNYLAGALNTVGISPPDVSRSFSGLPHHLVSLGYELGAVVQYYEILTSAVVECPQKPIEMLTHVVGRKVKGFDDLGPLMVTALRFSLDPQRDTFNVIIEPSTISPSSRLSLKLQYRSNDKDTMAKFHESINPRVDNFLSSLE